MTSKQNAEDRGGAQRRHSGLPSELTKDRAASSTTPSSDAKSTVSSAASARGVDGQTLPPISRPLKHFKTGSALADEAYLFCSLLLGHSSGRRTPSSETVSSASGGAHAKSSATSAEAGGGRRPSLAPCVASSSSELGFLFLHFACLQDPDKSLTGVPRPCHGQTDRRPSSRAVFFVDGPRSKRLKTTRKWTKSPCLP